MIKMNMKEDARLEVSSIEYFNLMMVAKQAIAIIPHIERHVAADGMCCAADGELWIRSKRLEDAIEELNYMK
jgi:sugar lactone lactonase YvrE